MQKRKPQVIPAVSSCTIILRRYPRPVHQGLLSPSCLRFLSEPSADQLQIVAAALGTTPAYLTGATDEKKLPAGAPSDEEDPLDTRLRELLSHADDDLKQAMIAFLERFQKK